MYFIANHSFKIEIDVGKRSRVNLISYRYIYWFVIAYRRTKVHVQETQYVRKLPRFCVPALSCCSCLNRHLKATFTLRSWWPPVTNRNVCESTWVGGAGSANETGCKCLATFLSCQKISHGSQSADEKPHRPLVQQGEHN